MQFKTKLKKKNKPKTKKIKLGTGEWSGWKTDASQLSAGVKPAAKLCLGPKGPFGNDGVGNTGVLGPPVLYVLPSWYPSSSQRLELHLELLLYPIAVQYFSP